MGQVWVENRLNFSSIEAFFNFIFGFESLHPHQTRIKRTGEKILSSFCFLQEIILDLKSNDKYITTFNRVF